MTPGPFTYTVTGAGLSAYGPIPGSTPCVAGVTCAATNVPNTFTQPQTFTAALIASTIGPSAAQQHTIPVVTSDTYALLAATQPLTNKTVDISANTVKSSVNTAGHYPRNNGSQYVDSTIQAADVPAINLAANGNGGVTGALALYVQLPAAGCNNATASSFWDLPTSNAPTPNCLTGTNAQEATLDFDHATNKTAQTEFAIPPNWTGNVDVDIFWLVTAGGGSNTVKFTIATACSAATATFDTAFNTANTITSGTVAANNNLSVTSQAAITTTGCASGNFLHVKFGRDVTDSSTATVRVLDVALMIRRTVP